MQKESRHVTLAITSLLGYARTVIRGVNRYAAGHAEWTFNFAESQMSYTLERAAGSDGMICHGNADELAVADRLGIPVVVVGQAKRLAGRAQVFSNAEAIGRVAAEHFLNQGLVHLAGWNPYRSHYSLRDRMTAFAELGEAAGCQVHLASENFAGKDHAFTVDDRMTWLRDLPKPVGVFCLEDHEGRIMLDAAHDAGLLVPDEVAVLGVNNVDLLCEMCRPALSSVDHGAMRLGYEAAAMLDRLMAGDAVDLDRPVMVEPIGVVARRSTELLAVDDPLIKQAVRYIEEHAGDGIQVDAVADAVGRSRRWLQLKFKSEMGRPVTDYITLCRLRQVELLLRESDLTLEQIAERTGYRYASHLSSAFKKAKSISPTMYRQQRVLK